MASRGGSRRYSNSKASSFREPEVREVRRRDASEHRDPRRREKATRKDEEIVYVYKYVDGGKRRKEETRPPPLRRSSHTVSRIWMEAPPSPPQRSRSEVVDHSRDRLARRGSSAKKLERDVIQVHTQARRRSSDRPRTGAPVTRSASLRERPPAPSPPRRDTSTRRPRPVSYPPPAPRLPEKLERAPSIRRAPKAPSSIFGSIFKPSKPPDPIPEKLVECLTCLSDVPISKSAKLSCTHRMCHACLRRIFTLSISDPQHMPPKCCTNDHIPLKHVEKLFDLRFKMKWNQKYQEYTTKNRVYCPARGCGEWIKPANIHLDNSGGVNGGRKYGKCSRCRTKVCCTCNGRWHSARECPKDEATARFAEIAKKEGWQRCFNCSATVELKEGCNHMTCRCRAEFCMICGSKWKTCDCPWFNYEAVEQDRLNHMQIPQMVLPQRRQGGGGNPALGYQEEMDRRREQERADEALARRLQTMGLGGMAGEPARDINEYLVHPQPPLAPEILHEILSGRYGPAQGDAHRIVVPPPRPEPPVMRQHSTASRAYNNHATTRASERVVPRRMTADYASERARHAPVAAPEETRPSMLAGLSRASTEGRVDAWRRYVDP